MLQTSNYNEIVVSVAELNTHNLDFAHRMKKFGLEKNCLINYEKRFVGFNVFEKYEQPMAQYLSRLIVDLNGRDFKRLLDSVQRQ
jgi:hypothetical protein